MLVEVWRGTDSPKPPQERGAHIQLARDGCCPHPEHAIQYVAFGERLWGTSVKERHAIVGREGVSSTVNSNLRCKGGVVESNDTADGAGAVFRYRQGAVHPRRDRQDFSGCCPPARQKNRFKTPEGDLGKTSRLLSCRRRYV